MKLFFVGVAVCLIVAVYNSSSETDEAILT